MTLTSDCNEEFFDARSDVGCPLPDDLLSDDDSDDGDEYVPSVATLEAAGQEVQQNHVETIVVPNTSTNSNNIKRAASGRKLGNLNRLSLTRSTSDTNIAAKSEIRHLLDSESLQKSKSASSDMEQSAALYRKQETEKKANGKMRHRYYVLC